MKFLIILLSIMLFSACSITGKTKQKDVKIFYFNNNSTKKIEIENFDSFMVSIDSIMLGIDDSFKLIVTDKKIKEIKENQSGIEIFFPNAISINLKNEQVLKLKKILIPFTNSDNIEKKSAIVLYIGEKKYFTPPYINSKGMADLESIKRIVYNNINNIN